jgi:hypothetical protein
MLTRGCFCYRGHVGILTVVAKLIRSVADRGIYILYGSGLAVTACLQWTQLRIPARVVCHCNMCIRVFKGIFGALFWNIVKCMLK